MWESKITKLKGGYSADVELMFQSWCAGIEAHIVDHTLNNSAALQLIKDQMLESAHHEVEYQLDLCGGVINYHELLKHLSVTFQGGEDEANILAEFYNQAQKPKESEETFVDELQLLTHKVISKRPAFREGLDTTLKQHYANQLYDHNNSSITKTLLLQMPMVTFTQFCNELAQVLGTHQHKDKPKSVNTNQVEVNSGETESISKLCLKRNAKISAQSSQIQDLHSKLDAAVAENSQMHEYLHPSTLQTAITNALQATQSNFMWSWGFMWFCMPREGKPFLGQPRESQLSVGKDGTTDPDKTCRYCKDTGHKLENCVHAFKGRRISKLIIRQDGSQTKSSCSWGSQGGAKVDPTIPISPTLQYDELLSTLASNAISMETKQRVMERAVSTCPTVNLNVQGKEVPSLMDSGSMVTLI